MEALPATKFPSYTAVCGRSVYLRQTFKNQEILWTFPFQSRPPSSPIQFINTSSKRGSIHFFHSQKKPNRHPLATSAAKRVLYMPNDEEISLAASRAAKLTCTRWIPILQKT